MSKTKSKESKGVWVQFEWDDYAEEWFPTNVGVSKGDAELGRPSADRITRRYIPAPKKKGAKKNG